MGLRILAIGAWTIGLVMLLAAPIADVSAAGDDGERHGGLSCGGCHAAKEQVKPVTAPLLVASQTRHCSSCHEKTVQVAHPVGFVPNRPLPEEFPLDWKGEMACSTCHGLHDQGPARLRGSKTGQHFCLSCHDNDFFEAMEDKGLSLRASGHLSSSPGSAQTVSGVEIDSYSSGCGECHADRVNGPNHDTATRGIAPRFGGVANHPVGSSYDIAATRSGYRPVGSLDRDIMLPDGKVSCLSCHEGYTRQHGRLVAVDGSLCKQCHIK